MPSITRKETPPDRLVLPSVDSLSLGPEGGDPKHLDRSTPALRLDTTPGTLSSGMVSPFAETALKDAEIARQHNSYPANTAPVTAPPSIADSPPLFTPNHHSSAHHQQHLPHHAPATAGDTQSAPLLSPLDNSLTSPAASSLMEGLATDMQARILAIQQQRSGRRATHSAPGSKQPIMLSRTPSGASVGSWRSNNNGSRSGSDCGLDSRLEKGFESRLDNSRRSSTQSSVSSNGRGSDVSPGSESELDRDCRQNTSITSPSMSANSSPPALKFDPSKHISSAGASLAGGALALGRTPSLRSRQRSSLSERRGLKLDPGALNSVVSPLSDNKGAEVNGNGVNSLNTESNSRTTEPNGSNRSMEPGATLHRSMTPASGGPLGSNGTGRLSTTNAKIPGPGELRALRQAPSAPNRPSTVVANQSNGKSGLFANYKKYIDIDTGRLNFLGKASIHSKGIDFSSGTSFSISLDELEPIRELGAGNYGTVNKVLHKPTNIIMAMKEIRLELDEKAFRQIIMELDVLHRCSMANIVEFYGAFFVEGAVYICMEYMDGGSMNHIYKRGIPEIYLKYIVHSVVEGLKQLKEDYNIIHRDVKPTNILCSTTGKVKLCDFGVSGNLVASIARTNIGCQAYMAPERIRGSGTTMEGLANGMQNNTYTVESDVWSLGLSIIEMAEGEYPYPPETYSNIFSQLAAIVDGEAPGLDPTKYSPEAVEFVSQLVSKDPKARPRYAEMLKHPWLADVNSSKIDIGEFVKRRLEELDS